MSRFAKAILLTAFVVTNVVVLWSRYHYGVRAIPGVGPNVAELGKLQVDMVIAWRNGTSVPLTSGTIRAFAAELSWSGCSPLPPGATAVSESDLSEDERNNLRQAFAKLLETYSRNDPKALYDYMLSRSKGISPAMETTLKALLLDGEPVSTASLDSRSPRELFTMVAENIQYDSHWESLVADSGCVSLWRADPNRAVGPQETMLGGSMAGLFKNQTRFHQLFEIQMLDSALANGVLPSCIFADVQFVVKHDADLQSEPSPYFIRFGLNRATNVWQPIEMIHVATISGNSPMLLF